MSDPARSPAAWVRAQRPERRRATDKWAWAEIERATGAPTICGNEIRLQFEGPNTFSAWLEAIEAAEKFVYFENYLLRDDEVGREFRDALVAKAKQARACVQPPGDPAR
jgi:cardiolipin synthase